jgi:hypothetical protein
VQKFFGSFFQKRTAFRTLQRVDSTAERVLLMIAFVWNGLLNIGWSLLFVRARRPDLARSQPYGRQVEPAACRGATLPPR